MEELKNMCDQDAKKQQDFFISKKKCFVSINWQEGCMMKSANLEERLWGSK